MPKSKTRKRGRRADEALSGYFSAVLIRYAFGKPGIHRTRPDRITRRFAGKRYRKLDTLADALGFEEWDDDLHSLDEVMSDLRHLIENFDLRKNRESSLAVAKVDHARQAMGLSTTEAELLLLALLSATCPQLQTAMSNLEAGSELAANRMISHALDIKPDSVHAALSSTALLKSGGFLEECHYASSQPRTLQDHLALEDDTQHWARQPQINSDALIHKVLTKAERTSLNASDFSYLADEFDLMKDLLRGADRNDSRGIHILIHGVPGSGKSELSRLLIQTIEGTGYDIVSAETGGRRDYLSGGERLGRYRVAQQILRNSKKSFVLFDECEDALTANDGFAAMFRNVRSAIGKGWMTKLLESSPRPTIWIANDVGWIDPALLRRFTYTLHMKRPPRHKRLSLAKARVGSHIKDPRILESIADSSSLTAADRERAARAMKLTATGNADEDVKRYLKILASRHESEFKPPSVNRLATLPYKFDWINSSVCADSIAAGFRRCNQGRAGLYGPPGTGKTAFVKALARQLEIPLIQKNASDLLGMYLGQTEQAIRSAFEEASDENGLLFFDEADSLLRSRGMARHSWEVSQVNELLAQIDNFQGCLVIASNHHENFDPAVVRRIDLKIDFGPLKGRAIQEVLEAACTALGLPDSVSAQTIQQSELEPRDIRLGDVATALRATQIAGCQPTLDDLLAAVVREQKARGATGAKRIGFIH